MSREIGNRKSEIGRPAWRLAERVPEALIVVMAVAAWIIALCGCGAYTVLPADREVVPIRQSGGIGERRCYVEDGECATGWYVPDATMLELLE